MDVKGFQFFENKLLQSKHVTAAVTKGISQRRGLHSATPTPGHFPFADFPFADFLSILPFAHILSNLNSHTSAFC